MLRKLSIHLFVLSLPYQIVSAAPHVFPENNTVVENNAVSGNDMASESNVVAESQIVSEAKGAAEQPVVLAVNINAASAEEIATMLQGIGLKKAQELVDFRNEHGAFQKVEDITKVKGIGAYLLEKNYARIQLR